MRGGAPSSKHCFATRVETQPPSVAVVIDWSRKVMTGQNRGHGHRSMTLTVVDLWGWWVGAVYGRRVASGKMLDVSRRGPAKSVLFLLLLPPASMCLSKSSRS